MRQQGLDQMYSRTAMIVMMQYLCDKVAVAVVDVVDGNDQDVAAVENAIEHEIHLESVLLTFVQWAHVARLVAVALVVVD